MSGNALARVLGAGGFLEAQQLWYNHQRVPLDGYHFKGCRFDGCILVAQSTNFLLEQCYVDPTTKVEIGGQLLKVIQLYNVHASGVFMPAYPFSPKRNADGTISVGL